MLRWGALIWVAAMALAPAMVHAAMNEDGAETDSLYWEEKNRGWFFYERKPKKPVAPKPVEAPVPPKVEALAPAKPPEPPKNPDLVKLEAFRKRVEESRSIAIINPSEENIRTFLQAQHEALEMADHFSDAAQRVVWATPELNPEMSGSRPSSAAGQQLFDAEESRMRKVKFAQMKETHAFFFFFRSDCAYCHQFAPMLKRFSQRTGIEVMAISVDGQGIREFPDFKADNGIATRLRVEQVPALYLAEPATGKVFPVGYGVISEVDLERRVDVITQPGAEELAPSTVKSASDLAWR